MNTDITLAFISTMVTSDASYKDIVEMINEMDLEIMGISVS